MIGSVLTVSSRAVLEACRRLGLDVRQLLDAAGLDEATVEDPDQRISTTRMAALWRRAYALSGDPDLALHAVERLPKGAYRVIEFLARHAPSVGASLTKVSDYFPIINSLVRLPISESGDEVWMTVTAPAHPALITRPYAEYTMAAIYLRTIPVAREPYRLRRVEFSHARPESVREHERIFGCPVRFGADACRLVLSRAAWETRGTGADPTLFDVMDAHARILLSRLPNDMTLAGRVREAIGAELRGGDPTLAGISRKLGASARTLQRRLEAEGVSFNDLLDAQRYSAARSYLDQKDIAATEVAYLLGFSSPSAFTRAFRRWAGVTPIEYRRRPQG